MDAAWGRGPGARSAPTDRCAGPQSSQRGPERRLPAAATARGEEGKGLLLRINHLERFRMCSVYANQTPDPRIKILERFRTDISCGGGMGEGSEKYIFIIITVIL